MCGADHRGNTKRARARPGSKPRLAWLRDCGEYEGVAIVLLLLAAGAYIWWLVRHKGWGTGQKVVFWVVVVVVVWVVLDFYSAPHPGG